MRDNTIDRRVYRRSLLKIIAAGSTIGLTGKTAAQANNSLGSIATQKFVSAATGTSFTGVEDQRQVYSDPAHGFPLEGSSYLVLSSGSADGILGSPSTFVSDPVGGKQIPNYSPDGYVANDVATFVVSFIVPNDAETVAFDYKFASEENPSFLESQYQDFFEAVVFPPEGNPQNIALLPDGDPVTVQNANEFANSPGGGSQNPSAPLPSSPDTVFNSVTDRQTATWNVSQYQGQEVSMFFRIADASDSVYDSAALIDNLRFAGDIDVDPNLNRVNAALDDYEQTFFDAIDGELRALANAEAKYYTEYGQEYADRVIDYFIKKSETEADPSVAEEIVSVADDALNGGPEATAADELYTFYDEMYSEASENMTEEELTDVFYNYYKGTYDGQSNVISFDITQATSNSQAVSLAQNGETLGSIIDFAQDCIVGSASASGLKQEIAQKVAESEATASAVEALVNAIQQRTEELQLQTERTTTEYSSTAETLTNDEDFKAKLVVPEVNESVSGDSVAEPQLLAGGLGIAAGGGALLKVVGSVGVGGAAKAAGGGGLLYLGAQGAPAASNALGSVGSTVGSGLNGANSYLGGQAAAGSSALANGGSIATVQTIQHFQRLQSLTKLFKLVDTAKGTIECGTTAFGDLLDAAESLDSVSDTSNQTLSGTELSGLQVEDLTVDDQIPGSQWARGTGSVTITNTGSIPITPELSASRITETITYTGIEVGAAQPLAFGDIPELGPGESSTIEFEYLAPVGGLLEIITNYTVEITEKQTNESQTATFDTEALDFDVSVPSATVADGTISTGETVSETVTTAPDAESATFTLDYDKFDGDLHLYDQQGNHVGIDYETGEIENEIPEAVHSGDDNGVTTKENISVSNPSGAEFDIEVIFEEIGTVVQSGDPIDAQQQGLPPRSESQASQREAAQTSQATQASISPIDAQASGAGTTEYTAEVTELTPQPANITLEPVATTVTGSGTVNTSLTVSEVGTFVDIEGVSASLTSDLSYASGDETLASSIVSFEDEGVSIAAGSTKEVPASVAVPSGAQAGTYEGTVELTASTAGDEISETASITITVAQDPEPTTTTKFSIRLDVPQAGLQLYNTTVSGPEGTAISAVEAGAIAGDAFQIDAGGEGESTVTAQAADLAGSVGADAGTVTLYNVTFEGEVARTELSLTVNELEGDNGDTISGDLVSVQLANPFPDGVPGISGDPPADPDGDGLYEDINADGTADFDDAVDLAFADTDNLSQAQTNALDFNGDGAVDFGDAIELAFDT